MADEDMVRNWDGEPYVGVGREREGCPSATGQRRVCLLYLEGLWSRWRAEEPFIPGREEPLGGFGKQAADERREDKPARDAPLRHLSAPDSIDVSLVPSH